MRPRSSARRSVRPAVLAAALLGVLAVYAVTTAQYEAYDLGYSAADSRAIVETWTVRLPFGYQLAWWKSTPHGPQDGLRLLGPE